MYVHLLWHVKFILLISRAIDVKGFPKNLFLRYIVKYFNFSGQCFEYICIQLIFMFISFVAILNIVKFSIFSIYTGAIAAIFYVD